MLKLLVVIALILFVLVLAVLGLYTYAVTKGSDDLSGKHTYDDPEF